MFDYETRGSSKKDQHIGYAGQFYTPESASDFVETRFVHHSLPELHADEIDISSNIAGIDTVMPFFVNAMTGGSKNAGRINQKLGIIGHYTKIPLASGSVTEAIKEPKVADSFTILRRENPYGVVIANLGAHHDVDNAKRAVDLLEANALQVHLNAPQELIMFEGDRDFSMWLRNIERIVKEISVPVIVKEVGFGMSRETIEKLYSVGVRTVDISGTGGTDFARIENARRMFQQYEDLNGWGQSTMVSLMEALSLPEESRPQVIASGGVKCSLDIVKCLAMGADMVGMSNHILQLANRSNLEDLITKIRKIEDGVQITMAMLGAKTVADLRKTDLIVSPGARHWAEARGIDWRHYANRSRG